MPDQFGFDAVDAGPIVLEPAVRAVLARVCHTVTRLDEGEVRVRKPAHDQKLRLAGLHAQGRMTVIQAGKSQAGQ
jgi:hypothetical protein